MEAWLQFQGKELPDIRKWDWLLRFAGEIITDRLWGSDRSLASFMYYLESLEQGGPLTKKKKFVELTDIFKPGSKSLERLILVFKKLAERELSRVLYLGITVENSAYELYRYMGFYEPLKDILQKLLEYDKLGTGYE